MEVNKNSMIYNVPAWPHFEPYIFTTEGRFFCEAGMYKNTVD